MREMPPAVTDGQRDDGLAAVGERRAADEVHLPADARVEPLADRVGADLAGEVHLDGAVDGGDARVAPDDRRVVHVGDVEHLDERVVVDEVVEPPRAHREAGDDLARVHALRSPVTTPRSTRSTTPSENISVWTPSRWWSSRAAQHRVGDGADAHLQRGAVLDQLRDVVPDGAVHRR